MGQHIHLRLGLSIIGGMDPLQMQLQQHLHYHHLSFLHQQLRQQTLLRLLVMVKLH